MSRICQISSNPKKTMVGNHVSYSKRRVKRKFKPNLVNFTVNDFIVRDVIANEKKNFSKIDPRKKKFTAATSSIRNLEKALLRKADYIYKKVKSMSK